MHPKDLLLGAIKNLKNPMEQAIDKHCGWHIRDIESRIVMSDASQDEMRMKLVTLAEGDLWFREYGCVICDYGPEGYTLTDCADSISGASMTIASDGCLGIPLGTMVGTFHTHPYGLPTPSYQDVMSAFIGGLQMHFIGGTVGGRKVIMGYSPHPESIMRWEMKQGIEPFDEFKGAKMDKFINFLYREPGAILPGSVSVKKFVVYDEDEEMDRFMDALGYLDGIFDMIIHWL